MKKRYSANFIFILSCAAFSFLVSELPAQSQKIQGDFEKKRGLPEKHVLNTMAEKFDFTIDPPQVLPDGWTLGLSGASRGGRLSLITDKNQAYSGDNFIYLLKGQLVVASIMNVFPYDEVDISFYGKNPAASSIDFILNLYDGSSRVGLLESTHGIESNEWTRCNVKMKVPAEINKKKFSTARISLKSNEGVYIDKIEINIIKSGEPVKTEPAEKEEAVKPGSTKTVEVLPAKPEKPVTRMRFDE